MSLLQQWLLFFSLASVASCTVNYTTVFTHGEGGWPCIRIPSIARCGGKLHAFAECRNRTGDGCIPTARRPTVDKPTSIPAGICYKSSSDDGGAWSEIKQVVLGATQPTVVCNTDNYLLLQYNVSLSRVSRHLDELYSFIHCRLVSKTEQSYPRTMA